MPKFLTRIRDGQRFHVVSGAEIECSSTTDCPFCIANRMEAVKEWVELHQPICALCDEQPPCFMCLGYQCKEWERDHAIVAERGSYQGCSKCMERVYCADFHCKHGFLGWWMNGWRERFDEVHELIEQELLKARRKKGIQHAGSKRKPQT
jgi:hypothetical protein